MSRWIRFVLLSAAMSGCATTTRGSAPTTSTTPYGADVTYTISASTLAELAQTGQDWKFTLSVQNGGDGERARGCTVAPAPLSPLAQRLTLVR
jgi:hypothetical protein